MAWIDVVELKRKVAGALHQSSPENLPASWDDILPDALDRGQRDIIEAMQGRGYTRAQVDAWNGAASMHKLQALYWALVMGVGLHTVSDVFVNKLDQRKALATPGPIVDMPGGAVEAPAAAGPVIVGQLDTENDRWNEERTRMW